jgi:hypothetical protein
VLSPQPATARKSQILLREVSKPTAAVVFS